MFKKSLMTAFSGGFVRSSCLVVEGLLIAKFLGAASFGIFAIALSINEIIFGLIDFKSSESAIKFISELRSKNKRPEIYLVVSALLGSELIKGLLSFGVAILAGIVAHNFIYSLDKLSILVAILATHSLLMTLNPLSTAFLRLSEKFQWIAIYDATLGIGSLLIKGVIAYTTKDILMLAYAYVAISFCASLSKNFLCYWAHRDKINLKDCHSYWGQRNKLEVPWRRLFSFSIDLSVLSMLKYFTKSGDILLLGTVAGPQSVGAYKLARRLRDALYYLTDPLSLVIYPEYAKRTANREFQFLKKLNSKVTLRTLAGATVGYIGIAAVAYFAIPILFGPSFIEAQTLIWILIPEGIFIVGLFTLPYLAMSLHETRAILHTYAIKLGVLACLGYPLASWLGAPGLCIAVTLAGLASTWLLHQKVSKKLNRLATTEQEKKSIRKAG